MSTTQRCCALVQEYDPELDKRCRPYLHPTNDSWRVDETYIARQREAKISVPGSRFGWQHFGSPNSAERDAEKRQTLIPQDIEGDS